MPVPPVQGRQGYDSCSEGRVDLSVDRIEVCRNSAGSFGNLGRGDPTHPTQLELPQHIEAPVSGPRVIALSVCAFWLFATLSPPFLLIDRPFY